MFKWCKNLETHLIHFAWEAIPDKNLKWMLYWCIHGVEELFWDMLRSVSPAFGALTKTTDKIQKPMVDYTLMRKKIQQMEKDNQTVDEKIEVMEEFKQAIEKIIEEEKLYD